MRRFRGLTDLRLWGSRLGSYGFWVAAVQGRAQLGHMSEGLARFPVKMRAFGQILRAPGPLAVAIIFAIAAGWAGSTRAADEPVRIVAFGDSLTAGYNLPASAAFPV